MTEAIKIPIVVEGFGQVDVALQRLSGDLDNLDKSARRASTGTDTLSESVKRVSTSGAGFKNQLQNTSYQLQDFITQVNGGVDATKALGQQLPQMLVGFGAAGAAIGVVAALLPNLIAAFTDSAAGAKSFSDAMSDFDKSIGKVGQTTKTFDLEPLYEQFNKSSAAVRAATMEQLRFQQEYIRTSQLVAQKKFGESLGGLGEYGTLNKLAGAFGSTPSDKLAGQLGISADTAKDLLPTLNGLRAGTEDAGLAFQKFGVILLGGNQKAVDLANSLATLSAGEKDAAAASSSLSEALDRMAKGTVPTKKGLEEAGKAAKQAAKEMAELDALRNGQMGRIAKEADKELASIAKQNEEYAKSLANGSIELERQAAQLEQQVEFYGMTEEAIQNTIVARLEEARAIAEANGASEDHLAYLDREIAARKRLASAASQKDYLEANKKAAAAAAKEWEKFADDIGRSLTDALYRAFESGDSFGQAFAKNLENTLKSMVLKFAIQSAVTTGSNLLNSGLNAVLGASNATNGAGNWFGLANNANSIYNLYGAATGYSSNVNALASLLGAGSTVGASSASLAYANAVGALGGDSLGALIAANGSWAGVSTGAAAAGSAGAATAAGATAAEGAAAAGSASAAGAAGSAAWIPYVGWAIAAAAAIYAFSDKIFGGDWEPSGAPRFTGAFSEANRGLVSGYTLQDYNKDGGWFGSDDSETRATAISNEFDAMLDRMYNSMRDSYLQVGKLFDDTDIGDKLVGFGLRLGEMDFSNAQAAVDAMAKQLGETMGRVLFPSIDALKTSGEAWATTFERVIVEAEAVDAVFKRLGTTLAEQFGKSNADKVLRLADGLVQAFGSVENMVSAAQKYYAGYYSQSEQTDMVRAGFAQQFAALGVAMPETRTQFRRLVDSLDLTSSAGQKTYAALLNMAEGFGTWADSLANTVDQVANTIDAALSGLFDGLLQEVQGARAGLTDARNTVAGVGLMSADQIRTAISTAVPQVPGANNIIATQAALQKATTDSAASIAAAILARDREQAAVNERNRGWSYLVADLPNIFGGAYNGGEQINEMWAIYNALSAKGLGTGFSGSSNYRNSSAYFNPLPAGYQYFLDGSPIGSSLQLNHGQDWVSANGITWGRYNRNLDVYAYKPYGTEVINPIYDQNIANAKTTGAAAITAAEQAATQAQIDYSKAIRQYVVDASKAVEKLNALRDETVAYYQAQQELANTMLLSATNLREAVKLSRQSQLSPEDLLAQQRLDFERAYAMALSTTGTVQAAYADRMAGLLPVIVSSLENTSATSVDWARAAASLYGKSNAIASSLETQAAVDFETEALGLLGAIDVSLATIEANASSAEKIISDAVYETGATTAEGLRAVIAAIRGEPIPKFAAGGDFYGGLRLVGERGPELEVTGPARIFNADQTRRILRGSTPDDTQARLIEALIAEVAALRAEVRSVAGHTSKTARKLEEVVGDGVIVRTETGYPLETVTA